MKKLFLLFTLISGFAFGQFKIIDNSDNYKLVGKYLNTVKLYEKKGKAKIDYYEYIDKELTSFTFEFSAEPDTLEKIYQIIRGQFEKNVENEVTLNFTEGNLYLYFFKPLGTSRFTFRFDDNINVSDLSETRRKREADVLSLKNVNKLFGKSK